MTTIAWLLAGLLVALAGAAAVGTRVPAFERPVRLSVPVAEAAVVLFVVADVGLLLRAGDRPDSLVTHVGYALAAVGLLPLLVLRAPAVQPGAAGTGSGEPAREESEPEEPEPVSLWVVVIALLAVAVCVLRLAATR